MIFFSPGKFGFYDDRIHTVMPDDVMELSDDDYAALLKGQADGLSIQYRDGSIGLFSSDPDRETVLRMLEVDLHRYIEDTHGYSIPSQATFQAVAADPSVQEDIRVQCRSVSRWIHGTVLPYYYKAKADVISSDHPAQVVWSFPDVCDTSSPGVTLSSVISKLV